MIEYRRLKDENIFLKYVCPICGNAPDIIHTEIAVSICSKCKIKWHYKVEEVNNV